MNVEEYINLNLFYVHWGITQSSALLFSDLRRAYMVGVSTFKYEPETGTRRAAVAVTSKIMGVNPALTGIFTRMHHRLYRATDMLIDIDG